MVHRGPHDRQPQGDVDGPAEGHQLDRHEALIVVAGDHRVELAGGAAEHRVGRDRVADVDPAHAAAGPQEPEPHEPVRLHDPSWAQPANCSPAAFGSS